eukprot:3422162-Pyramimonas_sp.AAC.1
MASAETPAHHDWGKTIMTTPATTIRHRTANSLSGPRPSNGSALTIAVATHVAFAPGFAVCCSALASVVLWLQIQRKAKTDADANGHRGKTMQ